MGHLIFQMPQNYFTGGFIMDLKKVTEQTIKGVLLSGGVIVAVSFLGKWAAAVAKNATEVLFPENEVENGE